VTDQTHDLIFGTLQEQLPRRRTEQQVFAELVAESVEFMEGAFSGASSWPDGTAGATAAHGPGTPSHPRSGQGEP
jgi:hypothetical protein